MPTTLTVHGRADEHHKAYRAWRRLINDDFPLETQEADLNAPILVFNNSIVGVSKMLHFAAPERFAIWDSKVVLACNFTFNGKRRSNGKAYLSYVDQLKDLVEDIAFEKLYIKAKEHVATFLEVEVAEVNLSKLRVGELLLFLSQVNSATVKP